MVTALTEVAREVAPVDTVPRDWRRLERRSALGAGRDRQLWPFAPCAQFRQAPVGTASRQDLRERRGDART